MLTPPQQLHIDNIVVLMNMPHGVNAVLEETHKCTHCHAECYVSGVSSTQGEKLPPHRQDRTKTGPSANLSPTLWNAYLLQGAQQPAWHWWLPARLLMPCQPPALPAALSAAAPREPCAPACKSARCTEHRVSNVCCSQHAGAVMMCV